MTRLKLTATISDQSILFTGKDPGPFLALIEHDGGNLTYVTVLLNGEMVNVEALGDEVADAIVGFVSRVFDRLTPPQLEAGDLASD